MPWRSSAEPMNAVALHGFPRDAVHDRFDARETFLGERRSDLEGDDDFTAEHLVTQLGRGAEVGAVDEFVGEARCAIVAVEEIDVTGGVVELLQRREVKFLRMLFFLLLDVGPDAVEFGDDFAFAVEGAATGALAETLGATWGNSWGR